jgi:hypothetical protein
LLGYHRFRRGTGIDPGVQRPLACLSCWLSPVGSPTIPATATLPVSSLAAAAGHGELIVVQFAAEKRLENLVDRTANPRNDLDSPGAQQHFQRVRDSAADQRFNAQRLQALNAPFGSLLGKRFLSPDGFARTVELDEQELPCHVENRGHAALPYGNCNDHVGR